MKYSKFTIKNFKGIRDLTLDLSLDPKLSIFTLVGLNESGKTTILEAIDLLQNDIPQEKRHTLIPKNRKLNFNEPVSVSAEFILDKNDENKIKNYCKSIKVYDLIDIKSFSIIKSYVFKDSKYISEGSNSFWTINLVGKKKRSGDLKKIIARTTTWINIVNFIKKELIPSIIYYPNFLFDFPDRIYLETFQGEKEEQSFYREVLQDILDSLNEDLMLNTHILERMKSETEDDKEALESTLQKISSKITKTVFKTWEALFKSKGREIIVKPGSEVVNQGESPTTRYFLEIKLKEGSDQYQIYERSLGFKWFFSFLLFTEFRKNRSNEKGEILFLLDEPASNLHSTAQARLLKTFKDLVDRSKLIYTTHSHHLIEPEWLGGAYIVKNKALDYQAEFDYDSSKTDIGGIPYKQFVAESPDQQTYFQPILDSLEYKPSKIELVPDITIVEGKNDFYAFKYFNEIIFSGKYKDFNLYPGNGAGKNGQVIRLYIAWGCKFRVFMDSDQAGKEAIKKYHDEIGIILKDKLFTYCDIDSKWNNIEVENLITDNDQLKIIQALDPKIKSQSKSKLHNAIEHLLFFKQKVNLEKQTITNFEKILKFLSK